MNEATLRRIVREELHAAIGSKISVEELISPDELAKITGLDVKTLANWRSKDKGPRSVKLEGKVMYKKTVVNDWIDAN